MIENYNNIKNLINNRKIGPIFFIAPNANRGIGLEKEIKNYHIICSQRTDIVDYLKKEKISVLCVDDDNIKNSGKILENKKVLSYIKRKSKNKTANIITFKPSPKLQKICDKNKFRYLGNDWKLNRKFEDKIEFVNITNKLKIPNAESKVIKIENNKKFKNLFNFKKKYVIQLSRGFSGNSTFLIKDKNSLNKIIEKHKGRKVKVSKYIEGNTFTVNVCVGKFGIVISKPILQITGLTDYNKNEFGTSGNDYEFSKNIGICEKKKIFNYTKKIGKYMKKSGYKGIFGLDFMVSDEENVKYFVESELSKDVNLIEINPRLIASIPVFTKLQIKSGQIPFLFLHLSEFFDIGCKLEKFQFSFSFAKWDKDKNFNFSQLILRNIKKDCVKIIKTINSGLYEFERDKLTLKKKIYFAENLNKNEFLIQTAKKRSLINSDIEYANIQVQYGIMKNKKKFNSHFNNIIRVVLKNIKY